MPASDSTSGNEASRGVRGTELRRVEFVVTGGMRAGWAHASWPAAKLTASEADLCVSGFMLGSYRFAPREVVSLDRISVPFNSSGIQIVHNRADYPARVTFWCPGGAEKLLARIGATGFAATAAPSSAIRSRGFPLQWWTLAALVILGSGLLYLAGVDWAGHSHEPGPGAITALALVFLLAWGIRASDWLQGLVLREGRSISEIKPALRLVQIVSGAMMIGVLVLLVARN